MLRESGASSTPRRLGSIADISGILDHPLSRMMTAGVWCASTYNDMSGHRFKFQRAPLETQCCRVGKGASARNSFALKSQRARGMPGAQCTRSLVRAGVVKYAHQYSQRRHRKHPAFPTQWFLRLIRDLPGDEFLFATVATRIEWRIRHPVGATRLHATWHQQRMPGPQDFAVRFSAVRLARSIPAHSEDCPAISSRRRCRVHRTPPHVS
jgi:hypothetical protein